LTLGRIPFPFLPASLPCPLLPPSSPHQSRGSRPCFSSCFFSSPSLYVSLCRSLIPRLPPSLLFPSTTGECTWGPGVFTIIIDIFPYWCLVCNKHSLSCTAVCSGEGNFSSYQTFLYKWISRFWRHCAQNVQLTLMANGPLSIAILLTWNFNCHTFGEGLVTLPMLVTSSAISGFYAASISRAMARFLQSSRA